MKKYNCYIVDKNLFKIKRDNVNFEYGYKLDVPLTAEDVAKNVKPKQLVYLFTRTSEYKDRKMYLSDICFKTEKEAEDNLIDAMRKKIEENEKSIRKLNAENCKLYEKIQKIYDKRNKKINEQAK